MCCPEEKGVFCQWFSDPGMHLWAGRPLWSGKQSNMIIFDYCVRSLPCSWVIFKCRQQTQESTAQRKGILLKKGAVSKMKEKNVQSSHTAPTLFVASQRLSSHLKPGQDVSGWHSLCWLRLGHGEQYFFEGPVGGRHLLPGLDSIAFVPLKQKLNLLFSKQQNIELTWWIDL